MRINRYVAFASGLSRRSADKLIADGHVIVDGLPAQTAQDIKEGQEVTLDSKLLELPEQTTTIMINKPIGYVVSRRGQGAQTIYSLLPEEYQKLKPIGRLDKDSSGLLLMSDDGKLIQSLAHPSSNKKKVYEVTLNRPLSLSDQDLVNRGIKLEDGLSRLQILSLNGNNLVLSMEEGRNRQIRRTFATLGYSINGLNRTKFGDYNLDNLGTGKYSEIRL